MRKFWLVVAAAVMLSGGLAWATDEGTFVSTLNKFGFVGTFPLKRPCLCHGGTFGDLVGLVYAAKDIASGAYTIDCAVQEFDVNGKQTAVAF
jgi:hypothetical protein